MTNDTIKDFLIALVGFLGFGATVGAYDFIGGMFLAISASILIHVFGHKKDREVSRIMTVGCAVIVSILAALTAQFFGVNPEHIQFVMGIAGFLSTRIVRIFFAITYALEMNASVIFMQLVELFMKLLERFLKK
jgi:hypothetical protein